MTFLNILRLSTALSLSMAVSSYSLIFASQQMSMKEECAAAAFANPISKSNDQRLQGLEDQRDAVDFRDYPRFKELTCEISSIIGSFPAKGALPKGEELHRWIDSITRTRHKFSGQACLGKYGMANRYLQSVDDLDNPEHRNHMIVIMAIDAMVKRAIEDEDFSAMWSEQASDSVILEEFIEKVIETLNARQFGWPKKKEKASLSVKIAPFETSDISPETVVLEKKEKKSEIAIDLVLGSVVQDIFGYHNQRCDVYNTPLNEVLVDGAIRGKSDIIEEKTHLINTVLKDKERVDTKRHASTDEKKAILQSVMGTEILAHTYQDEKRQTLRLASELPVGLAINDPRFKHFEILRLTEEVSQKLVAHVREYGYESLYEVTLNRLIGNAYANLFAYSGLEEGVFFNWFKEVFESHKAGFLAYTKPFDVDDLSYGVRAVLTKRPDIVRLAGDIFNLYAPKLDLNTIYIDVMPSGGKWRGWDVHQVDSFAHVINLTDEENAANPASIEERLYLTECNEIEVARIQITPSLETQLRNDLKEVLSHEKYDLYSTSIKGFLISEEDSQVEVTYIYDPCLPQRALGVIGKGAVSFHLRRKIKSELKHLTKKTETLSPDYLTELYASLLGISSQDWYKKGIPYQIYLYGKHLNTRTLNCFIKDAYDPLKALDFYREAINLGREEAKKDLLEVIDNCVGWYLNWEVDVNKAVLFFREALYLGSDQAKEKLIGGAKSLILGHRVEKDMTGALTILKELCDEKDVDDVIDVLNTCGCLSFGGSSGFEKNTKLAIKCFEKAMNVEGWNKRGKHRDQLHKNLMECAKALMQGYEVERDIHKALFILNKIATKVEHLKSDVTLILTNFGVAFCKGNEGLERNIDIAIEFFRKAASLGDGAACKNLISCAEILMAGLDVKRDMSQAISLLRNLARSNLYRQFNNE